MSVRQHVVRIAGHEGSGPSRVVGWLVGGVICLFSAQVYLFLVPEVSSDLAPFAWLFRIFAAAMVLAGAFCLGRGLRRSFTNPPSPFSPVRGHTVSMVLLSLLFGAWSAVHEQPAPGEPDLRPFMTSFFGLLSLLGIATAVSRLTRSPVASDLTATLNFVWASAFPFGTAQFIWWFLRLRHREAKGRAA